MDASNGAPGSSGVGNAAYVEVPPDAKPELKNKPSDSKFKQQKLPAWQPILTAGTVLPAFFIVGLIFIPAGIFFLVSSNRVFESITDYTDCVNSAGVPCSQIVVFNNATTSPVSCICTVQINVSNAPPPSAQVFMYYSLQNFFQNHRRYVKSRDDNELLGVVPSAQSSAAADCAPYRDNRTEDVAPYFYYAPCGAIANSLFNDTLTLTYASTPTAPVSNVTLVRTGIAWYTDKTVKFKNPPNTATCGQGTSFNDSCWANAFGAPNAIKPPFWSKNVWELDIMNSNNNGYQNEDLIVWMRTAALPSFRKLYAKVSGVVGQDVSSVGPLPAGTYMLTVNYTYPVALFGGRKRVILSTTSWLGGKNPFLGIAYIVVGALCVCLGVVFLVIHLKFGKSLSELSNITAS